MSVIASRELIIRHEADPEFSPLHLTIGKPKKIRRGHYETAFELRSKYFTKRLTTEGSDSFEALMHVSSLLHAYLVGLEMHSGYEVGWSEPGDFHAGAFWSSPDYFLKAFAEDASRA